MQRLTNVCLVWLLLKKDLIQPFYSIWLTWDAVYLTIVYATPLTWIDFRLKATPILILYWRHFCPNFILLLSSSGKFAVSSKFAMKNARWQSSVTLQYLITNLGTLNRKLELAHFAQAKKTSIAEKVWCGHLQNLIFSWYQVQPYINCIFVSGPNVEVEQCLPGVIIAQERSYTAFLLQLADMGCSLSHNCLRDSARAVLNLIPADNHTALKIRTLCSDLVLKPASNPQHGFDSLFFTTSPSQTLYNLDVCYR